MGKKDLLTFIVPVYNGQDYLEACVKSIVSQQDTAYDLEIIVVNDGSTDDTARICLQLEQEHDKVRFITISKKGVSAGRNVGLQAAQGEYISFVDVDDRLLPGAARLLYRIIKENESDIAGMGFMTWSGDEEYQLHVAAETGRETKIPPVRIYSGIEYLDKGFLTSKKSKEKHVTHHGNTYCRGEIGDDVIVGSSRNHHSDTRCWGKLYHHSILQTIRFDETITIGEDMLFLLEVLQKTKKITVTDYKGYAYYVNPAGAILRPFHPCYMDQITCWQIAREKMREVRPDLDYRVTASLIKAIMLIVGKIATLAAKERGQCQEHIDRCSQSLAEAMSPQMGFRSLTRSDRFKVRLFLLTPKWYMRLYNRWKKAK
ncbi:MAG: glycosyltransferase [Lachnospiraceae bacterium]|jgi:glycosyltransferase involved in cell wall biosynthesis|nr:glycosyltransferase [Lachnospiraceae bacterium]